MMESTLAAPYIIHINESIQTIHLSEELNNIGIQIAPNTQDLSTLDTIRNSQILVESARNPIEMIQDATETVPQNFEMLRQEQPCIVQIVYPQDLSLSVKPTPSAAKRGRPKKKKTEEVVTEPVITKSEAPLEPQKSARTRSGRLVKLPKHIEKDFTKIEISSDEKEILVSDFKRVEEKENSKFEFTYIKPKKRVPQYKCPKCFKTFMVKSRMIQHFKKCPDHGPVPVCDQESNFNVWNYLYDITQKCKSGQRGVKFCEELSNLLHNVQLLKSALFKTVTDERNCVHIDKVLGNAIGLSPGKYEFDENELYKDVTVLKLITNSEFFKPSFNKQNHGSPPPKNTQDSHECLESRESKSDVEHHNDNFTSLTNDFEIQDVDNNIDIVRNSGVENRNEEENLFTPKTVNTISSKAESNTQLIDNFSKKMDVDNVGNPMPLASDLLSENLLLHSLPSTRSSVDELMLTSVDNSSSLLDNSTSSDEVMNVDQFVNERFKKIIEPDIEIGNAPLNLDLPSLELFQFHTS